MSIEKLGLSHTLSVNSSIVHSTVMGVNCLGRITDLLSAWCRNELDLENDFLSDFRLLLQGLLEFSCPKNGDSLGQIELADDQNFLIVAARFPCRIPVTQEALSKELTQYWLNSPEVTLLKRMLGPQDRVEVRYHAKMHLIEWRVCRPRGITDVEIDHAASFRVFTDLSAGIDSADRFYQDLGDLPFNEWLSDTYKNKNSKTRAGNVRVEGESHDQQEWARVVVDREKQAIDAELDQIFKSENFDDEEVVRKFSRSGDEANDDEVAVSHFGADEIESILSENKDLKEAAQEISKRIRASELALEKEKILSEQKLKQMEVLLHKKEFMNQKSTEEANQLRTKLTEQKAQVVSGGNIDHFRAKAMEMFEMLKKVKEEKREVEKNYHSLMSSKESGSLDGAAISQQKLVDELTKKAERTQRALEAEKVKVKSLYERVTVAEKEAQSSGPIIEDLESKIEFTLKTVQQHKKETEQVKQKLVQSDAEKNRIKNDLVKAQAQIQTLMKRQAA